MEYKCANCYQTYEDGDDDLERLKRAGVPESEEENAFHNGIKAVAICDRMLGYKMDKVKCGGMILPVAEHPCEVCEQEVIIGDKGLAGGEVLELFDSPFDKEPRRVFIHTHHWEGEPYAGRSCIDLLQDTSWDDFRYFQCPKCGRWICRQYPGNGWHSQMKPDLTSPYYEEAEDICNSCYEREILKNGISLEALKRFGLSGTFLDQNELRDEGWEPIQEFHITSEDQKELVEKIWKDRQDKMKLLIDYDSMAIGYLEGYITVWGKPREVEECKTSSS